MSRKLAPITAHKVAQKVAQKVTPKLPKKLPQKLPELKPLHTEVPEIKVRIGKGSSKRHFQRKKWPDPWTQKCLDILKYNNFNFKGATDDDKEDFDLKFAGKSFFFRALFSPVTTAKYGCHEKSPKKKVLKKEKVLPGSTNEESPYG